MRTTISRGFLLLFFSLVSLLTFSQGNDITGFFLADRSGSATYDFDNHHIRIQVHNGTDISNLAPTINVSSGASISPASGVNRDFTSQVIYTVTDEDGAQQDWTVKVNEYQGSTTSFITTWKTDNSGNSNDDQITIPVHSAFADFNYEVDWGDGNTDNSVTGSITHTYASAGTYTVSITGIFPNISFIDDIDNEKILSVEQWGDNDWSSFYHGFDGCSNLQINATDQPDLSNVSNMQAMFRDVAMINSSLVNWDMSNVTDISSMFENVSTFNQDIGAWDVSNVTLMAKVFKGATSFNQDISSWEVKHVTLMDNLFQDAISFNQPLGDWKVGEVTGMLSMFLGASAFNQDISAWDVSNVTDMGFMFRGATAFNQDLSVWNVSSVMNMNSMFHRANAFNANLENWDVSLVTNMTRFLSSSGMSSSNYDKLLTGWSALTLQSNVSLGAFELSYCNGQDARQSIIDNYSWTITDGGLSCLVDTDIIGVTLSEVTLGTTIDATNHAVYITVLDRSNLADLNASFELSLGATISPISGSSQDFGSPVVYTVTAEDGTSQDWTVTITKNATSFVTKWKTDNPGFSGDNQIRIPITGSGYNYDVDWGDGNTDAGVTGAITHTYASPGIYVVSISGDFPRIYFNNATDRQKLLTIEQWGSVEWQTMEGAFHGCSNLTYHATDAPDLSNVLSMERMFERATLFNGDIKDWDVSMVTNMARLFSLCDAFNQDISMWDVSGATNMHAMLFGAKVFNQDVGSWDVGNVTNMSYLFSSAFAFNQDIGNWDVSKVTNMQSLFSSASSFDQDIGDWNVEIVTNMRDMFTSSPFNQDISRWDVSNVENMSRMFVDASQFNQDIDNWNVGKVSTMEEMFFLATSFNQDLNSWDLSSVDDMNGMFNNARSFNGSIGDWDLSNVNVAFGLFTGASAFNQDISNWDISSLQSLTRMFHSASSFNQDISSWDTQNITDMSLAFFNATSFNQDVNAWDVTNVANMQHMFSGASSYDQSMEDWQIFAVSDMSNMFDNSGLSRPNYDTTVKGWADLNVQPNVTVGAQGLSYCTSESERQRLINNKNWIFSGDSKVCGTEAEIMSFMLPGQIGSPFIDSDNATVTITVLGGTDLSSVVPDVQISEFGLLTPSAGQAKNFSIDRSYRVNSEDGNAIKDWTIKTNVLEQTNFITTWDTRKTGTSNNDQITIPVNISLAYDYEVDWGDGNTDTNVTGSITHTYASEGEYVVSISGTFPAIYFKAEGDAQKILNILNWGNNPWESMAFAFEGCGNLTYAATDTPDLSNVTDMTRMFRDCIIFNGDIGNWDVSNVELMIGTFSFARAFNQDIGDWDMSSVTDISFMFTNARVFNQDMSDWDMSNVTRMVGTFNQANAFNQDIGDWNVSSLTSLFETFLGATSFNQDISDWDVSNVTDMRSTFVFANAFNQNIADWDVSKVTTFGAFLFNAPAFTQDLSRWNTSSAVDMSLMFQNTPIDFFMGDWDVSKVTNMSNMLSESGMSGQNYDQTLIAWSTKTLQDDVPFGATGVTFCKSATARQSIIDNYNWTITDAGISCNSETDILSLLVYDQSFDEQIGDAVIDLVNHTVSVEVLTGVNLASMFADIELSTGATSNLQGGFRRDYSLPRVITVTAEDGTTTQDWTITVSYFGGSTTAFITTWKTDNVGDSNDDQITIPTTGIGYDFTVDWGDGNSDNNVTGNITHTYVSTGTYTVSITGSFPRIYFNNGGDKLKLLTVEQWGDNPWLSFENAFQGCESFDLNATDVPDLAIVSSMENAFFRAKSFNGDVTQWDVSTITNMQWMFGGAILFNRNISNWDVSNVTDMSYLFAGARAFNQNINDWDVSRVTDMQWMFANTTNYNQPLDDWDVSNVTNMDAMFGAALGFNQDISGWDVSNVTSMNFMFQFASQFSGDLSSWDVSKVKYMVSIFNGTTYNGDISSWDVGNVELMTSMFRDNTAFNQDISGWNTSKATTMKQMFLNTSAFNQDISDWDVSSVTEMDNMLQNVSMFNYNLGSWDVTSVTIMTSMLSGTGLSKENYDATMTGWAAQSLQQNVSFGAGGLPYCTTNVSRQKLVNDFSWTILGDVIDCETGTDISSISLPFLVANPIIDATNHTITLEVAAGTDLTALAPLIELGDNASISPASGVSTDFSNQITYTVTAEDGITVQDWIITVNTNQTFFTTTWKTDNAGVTDGDQVRIPTRGFTPYQYKVYWGDGSYDENIIGSIEHTYAQPGTYTISITGDFPAINFDFKGDKEKLIAIEQWGDISWSSMTHAFSGCSKMVYRAIDQPDLSNVKGMTSMFQGVVHFNGAIDDWDVSNVTSMGNLFNGATAFNQDLNSWNVSNVNDMSGMFSGASSFNGDITGWNVSNVRFMNAIFSSATAFNQDIGDWSVESVLDMGYMFINASAFNQNIGNWDVSKVTNMEYMFTNASSFDQPVGSWNVGSVTNMQWMFNKAKVFNQPIGSWDVSKVTKMNDMFSETDAFNQDINTWDVSSVTTIDWMFWRAIAFDQPVGNWDVSSLTTLVGTFNETPFNQDISSWDVSGVTDMRLTFANNDFFNQDLSHWDVSNVTNMFGTFLRSLSFNEDISAWDVSSVTNMLRLFDGATLFDRDLSDWQVASVTNASQLFDDSGLSNENYDNILLGWSTQSLQNGLTFGAENINYCESIEARQLLIDSFSWTIIDGEQLCNGTDILTFEFTEQNGASSIDEANSTVAIELPNGTDLTGVAPSLIAVSYGATISHEQGVMQDFSSPVTYTVSSADGSTEDWLVYVTEAPSSATEITAFDLAKQTEAATISALDHEVSIEVSNGTNLTTLVPTISFSSGATISPESGASLDFSAVVTYTVTAEDGTIQDWSVTVTEAPSNVSDIVTFVLEAQTSSATINADTHTVMIEVANGTDVTALTPTISLSQGASISPNDGSTQDFSAALTYLVTAEDGTTTQEWTVTVIEAPANASDIVTFVLDEQTSSATINTENHTVMIEVANGTDVTALIPTIGLSEGAIISPISGTAQDFSAALTYLVTAEDGTTTQEWTVIVIEAPANASDIVTFVLDEQTSSATINIENHTVTIEVENDTDVTALTPTIGPSEGASISPNSETTQDFSAPVTYLVTSEDGNTSQEWTVTVELAADPLSNETDILSFELSEQTGKATIDAMNHTIGIEVENGTDVTALMPTIELSDGASISPNSGTTQDFSLTVTYMVTAKDGTTIQDWEITVTESLSTETDIISFELEEQTGPATINFEEHSVVIEVAEGTELSEVTIAIEVSGGASYLVVDGMIEDFTASITYMVTAEDGTTAQDWLVTITTAPSSDTDILAFAFVEQTGPAIINDTDHTISIEVESGTDVTSLTPTIGISEGATISPEAIEAQDFSVVVTYMVTAQDGSTTQDWVVTIAVEPALLTSIIEVVSIYPNPVASELIIDFANQMGQITLVVTDVSGKQLIQEESEQQTQVVLDVSELFPGIYFLQVKGQTGDSTYRFIKE